MRLRSPEMRHQPSKRSKATVPPRATRGITGFELTRMGHKPSEIEITAGLAEINPNTPRGSPLVLLELVKHQDRAAGERGKCLVLSIKRGK